MKISTRAITVIGASLLALSTNQTWAADAAVDEAEAEKDPTITVTATRLPTETVEVPATVSVIDEVRIADELATDIKDLIRFEPGVSVTRQPARFGAALGTTGRAGNEGLTIRGIGGNRVLIQVDGVRVPDGFSFGAQGVGRGDYVDLGLVKSVEILRGPASALYGSDGLAGAVSFITSDPSDFLRDGKSFGGLVRGAYSSADNEFSETAILAAGGGSISGMIAYTRRDYKELENQGTNDVNGSLRTTPNPQDGRSDAVLGRLVFEPAGGHKIRLTGEYLDTRLDANVLSGRSATVLDLRSHDTGSRARAAIDWSWTGSGTVEFARLAAYWQQGKDRQFTFEDRNPAVDRTRINTFDNRVIGASGEVRLAFGSEGFANRMVLGGDISWTRQEGLRDGTVPPAGETFPTRAFPVTNYMLAGLFLSDEISIGNGLLTLYPALRLDAYKLTPTDDPLLPTFAEAGQSDSRLSPKLGAVVKLGDVRLYGSWARGFKAPEPSQVNNFFANPPVGYISIPNPNLRPETSETFEVGARLVGDYVTLEVAAFHANYKDFIEQIETTGLPMPSPANPWIYQWVNQDSAKVKGVEVKLDLRSDSGFTGKLAISYATGKVIDGVTAVRSPLASVDPLKLVAGIGYRAPDGRFGGQIIATHSARKKAKLTTGYRPWAFTILDATAFVRVGDFTLRAGVFNIFDEKYSWWSDVRGLSSTSAVLDAYTQPGRNASVSLSFRF